MPQLLNFSKATIFERYEFNIRNPDLDMQWIPLMPRKKIKIIQ